MSRAEIIRVCREEFLIVLAVESGSMDGGEDGGDRYSNFTVKTASPFGNNPLNSDSASQYCLDNDTNFPDRNPSTSGKNWHR